ncbi:MAG: tRNA (adenosine(37)-N6)-threonylcarbamoyltransferase complex ATPase subunit type 1 TsaE [Lachnospiraceae bacterium]|nr:tRNA (adenosine(37)-N6)-threonylcarbamoyltransferase complex ATPase subunit type 1 TsaE [Lachnospiraceae bacterium]
MIIETNKPEETYGFAKQLSEQAKPGQVFTLTGDLGVGKTVFTKGFAAGLAVTEDVNSPTFTIVQEYTSGRIPFYHFDVYRIGDVEELYEIGFDDYLYGDGVCMIEWANLIEEALPDVRTDIVIEKDLERGFDYRRITVEEHT